MSAASTRLRLRVVPGSRKPGIVRRHGDAWKLHVAAAPEDDRANTAALHLLAESLDVDAGALRLVAGRSSRDKVVEITGLDASEAERRLAR